MKTVSAYAKLLRVPGIGALGIVPVIAALTVGIYDLYNLTIFFIIGITLCFSLNPHTNPMVCSIHTATWREVI